jgi:hypothetical protein
MVRKQIYITEELQTGLKQMSEATGESEAELVRQALASYLQGASTSAHLRAWQEERKFIESRLNKNSSQSAHTWTREELYDRYDDKVSR